MDSNSFNVSSTQWILHGVVNGVAVLVCLTAAILVFILKLHTKVVYRLALYQVLSSLALVSVTVLQTVLINFDSNQQMYGRVCTAMGWLAVYFQWVKLLFTTWVTFHLFCFGVLHKNPKKLEIVYVVTSLTIPSVVAALPLVIVTNTYGLAPRGGCYILGSSNDSRSQYIALIERLALWDGPAMAILLAASAAMVAMVIKLACRVCSRLRYEPISDGDQYWKALKQLLPLSAFPILFFVLKIPELILDIYVARRNITYNDALIYSSTVFISLWSTTSGVTLLVHIIVARCVANKRKRQTNRYGTGTRHKDAAIHTCMDAHGRVVSQYGNTIDDEGFTTVKLDTRSALSSTTHFSLPFENLSTS